MYKSDNKEVEDFYSLNQDIKMETKEWRSSKTLWFNIIIAIIAILALPEFVAVLDPVWLKYASLIGAIGNTILRLFFTETKLV